MPKVVTKVAYPPQLQRKKRVAAYARVSSGKDAMAVCFAFFSFQHNIPSMSWNNTSIFTTSAMRS